MATLEVGPARQSKLGIASCAAFGLSVFWMLALNAMLGNLADHRGTVDTHDSAVKPAFASAVYTLYVDVPVNLLGMALAIGGLFLGSRAKTACWTGLAMNAVSLLTLLGCYGLVSWMTGIK